jgi:membrane protein YqaA with SNARE-associated domain
MHWHYKNLTILFASFLFAYAFGQTYLYQSLLGNLKTVGWPGIFIVGTFFTSIFTVAPAAVVLVGLGKFYDPLVLAPLAGAGAMFGDYVIFRFIREGVLDELKEIIGKRNLAKLLHPLRSRYFVWLLPLVGAVIIASPLPDEAGVAMMGISKIRRWVFMIIAFTLNTAGVYLLVTVTN